MPPDRVFDLAISAFESDYGLGGGAPIAVLIPALDEVETVGAVVRAVPGTVRGLATEVILIDDGSTDGTSEAARRAGAMVCRFSHNLGQGKAFHAGYRLAQLRGSRFIATLDADGQFDPAELPGLIEPLLEDEADFVNGSRRLGRSHSPDPVRRVGVVAFGWLVSLLTRVKVTDPANGLRAFRTEVPSVVPLRQPQYQTAELLIGAIGHGYRLKEVPVTMFKRESGASKKGRNFRYAFEFGRVVLTTWWTQMGRQQLSRRPLALRRAAR